MTDDDNARKLDELDRLLNDPYVGLLLTRWEMTLSQAERYEGFHTPVVRLLTRGSGRRRGKGDRRFVAACGSGGE